MLNVAIIIPALNPTPSLIEYVKALLTEGAAQIIVVNDGSRAELTSIFTECSQLKNCTVLTHDINKGKGRALKTAFTYFLKNMNHLAGVITADADGQHAVEDVCKLAKLLAGKQNGILLGVRDFSQANVPFRSRLGNRTTSLIFRLLYGYKLEDTQTGLRGIPASELPSIANLKGERYEYEINMLIYARKMNISMDEIPIQTLYFNDNDGSHYNSIIDSFRVFRKLISGLLRYSFSTIASGVIDIICFILLANFLLIELPLKTRVFFATMVARALSSTGNYYLNRNLVFKAGNRLSSSLFKYYLLVISQIVASYVLVVSANLSLGANIILVKIFVDTLLGIVSYQLQLHWVFKKNYPEQIAGESNGR
ncbi:glycosyltransferase [Bacillota bacterium Lsc_1132]